jgi:hypothetical protein
MRINILCKEEDVEEVLQKYGKPGLVFKASETGRLPSTHRVCSIEASKEKIDELLSLKEKTIMEEGNFNEFLKKWNLKMISLRETFLKKTEG